MRAVFLFGTEHCYQAGRVSSISRMLGTADPTKSDLEQFRTELRRVICEHFLRGIAEEMHPDALRQKYETENPSLPYQVAAEIGVKHLYCEPSMTRRNELGLDTDDKREDYWLSVLKDWDAFPALFVLGANHVQSFGAKLSKVGFKPEIVAHDWSPKKEV